MICCRSDVKPGIARYAWRMSRDLPEHPLCLFLGSELAAYAFGEGHPFGAARYHAFVAAIARHGLEGHFRQCAPRQATVAELERFHHHDYVAMVRSRSISGEGYLDAGDTPAFVGMYEAAATVVGTVLEAAAAQLGGRCLRAFVPIAGLHHARRDGAAGFCIFNDCGVLIETLHREYGVERIAYVDIDAHHGDGVFYGFEAAPWLTLVDLHEDGRFLYPGSGAVEEIGRGAARGTKLNIPLLPGADDGIFFRVWAAAERFIAASRPQFIILQCGADSLGGDPITDMRFTAAVHRHVAGRLRHIADAHAGGRLLVLGGGGYNLENIATAWTAVVEALA